MCWLLAGPSVLMALLCLPVSVASATWLEPRAVSHEGLQAVDPQVAVDGNGDVIVAWVSGTSSQDIVVAEHPAGGEWTNPVTRISETEPAKACQDPKLAVDSAGAAILVADCGTGTTPMRAATRSVNGIWSGTSAEIPGTGSAGEPRVGIDDSGNAVLVWEGGGSTAQSAYRPGGAGWSSVVQLSTGGKQAFEPNVAMTHDGYAFALWRQKREGSVGDPVVNVLFSRRHGGGSWEATSQLTPNFGGGSTTPVAGGEPQIAVSANDQKLAAWTIENPGVKLFTESHASGGALSGWEAGKNISEAGVHVEAARIAIDGNGLGIATFRSSDEFGFFRVKATAAATLGGAWASPVTLSGPVSLSIAAEPAVAVDPAGDGTVVWRAGSEVAAPSRLPGGAFGAAATISDSAHQAFGEPLVTMSSSGDAIAAWTASTSPAHIALAVNDVTPPLLTGVSAPTSIAVGAQGSMTASASDAWSSPTITWDFGDGGTATGGAVSHTYSSTGARTVTVTATDAAGNTASQTRQVSVTRTEPGRVKVTATVPKQTWKAIEKAKAIKLRCELDADGTCSARATVAVVVARRLGLKVKKGAKTVSLGQGSAKVSSGQPQIVKLKLNANARKTIAAATRNVPVAIAVTGSAPGREPGSLSTKLRIKRP
jgi:PKD repeat protein